MTMTMTMTKGRMISYHKEYIKAINTSIAAAKDSKHPKWVVNHQNGEAYADDLVCFYQVGIHPGWLEMTKTIGETIVESDGVTVGEATVD